MKLLFVAVLLISFLSFVSPGFATPHPGHNDGLRHRYYHKTCPQAEEIIRKMMDEFIKIDSDIAPHLVRMHFHDCFIRGCDGSILLNSTSTSKAEKDASINKPSLGGFGKIEKMKAALEAACPNTVSCADLLAYATREAVHKAGNFPRYKVRGGRKDGRVSCANETESNLPRSSVDLKAIARFFRAKNLRLKDAVTLLGAHSFGDAHCSVIGGRYEKNFNHTGKPDPTLNPALAAKLRKACAVSSDPTVSQDSITPDVLDNKYYVGLLQHKGLFTADAALLTSKKTRRLVRLYAAKPATWKKKFAKAMIKLGEVQVKYGEEGEIRKRCDVVN
ncbi:peroxidase 5-like [Nymphaea colorata]|nr:peroxidase 5-like [Nymphaea colorata]